MDINAICGVCGDSFGRHVGIDARCLEGIAGITFKRKGYEDWQGAICQECYRPVVVLENGALHLDLRAKHTAIVLQFARS